MFRSPMMMKEEPLLSLQFWSWVRKIVTAKCLRFVLFCLYVAYMTMFFFLCLFVLFFLLVPPSPPICSIKGQPQYGHNISLTCKSEEGSPAPETKWKTFTVENVPRPYPPKAFQCMYFTMHFSCKKKDISGRLLILK